MKFLNLFLFNLAAGHMEMRSIADTENQELVQSLDTYIKRFLDGNNSTISDADVRVADSNYQGAPAGKITNEEEARGFVKFAGAAYCTQESVLNWSCGNCHGYAVGSEESVYFSDEETNTAGYLTINKPRKLIVLGYRGTRDITNWLYNIDTSFTEANLPSPYNEAQYHTGFDIMTKALLNDSRDALSNALKKYYNYKVVFTGHSLGGALAAMTAYKLAQEGLISWEKINLLTYGQPRLGNPDFAAYLNSKPWTTTRVTSYGDLVAISPGRTAGYMHHQYCMHINKNGQTVQCSIYEEDKKCIADHKIPFREAHFTYWDQRMNTDC
jgi:hypothetical protein